MNRSISPRVLRYLAAGVGNAVVTYLLYLLLLKFIGYRLAYSLSFVAGIGLGYLVNAFWVFDKIPTARSALAYPAIYVVQYIMGLALLAVLVEVMDFPKVIAPLFVVVATQPAVFLLTKYIFSHKDYL